MTSEQKLAALQRWHHAIEASDATLQPVVDLLKLDPESPVCQTVYQLQEAVTASTAQMVGDEAEWLAWFHCENDMGRKGMEAGPTDGLRPIRSLEDLLWVIEVAA